MDEHGNYLGIADQVRRRERALHIGKTNSRVAGISTSPSGGRMKWGFIYGFASALVAVTSIGLGPVGLAVLELWS